MQTAVQSVSALGRQILIIGSNHALKKKYQMCNKVYMLIEKFYVLVFLHTYQLSEYVILGLYGDCLLSKLSYMKTLLGFQVVLNINC